MSEARRTGGHGGGAGCVLVAVTALVAVGGTASAQAPPLQGSAEVQPPADNSFPVPPPHEASFVDDWHVCRDGCRRQHQGNDVVAAEGSPMVAVEGGEIVDVDNSDDGPGGFSVWLRGDSGVTYYYGHNAENLVDEGQRVSRGQMIAQVGHTGNARTTASHIHFQLNLCGQLSSDEPCTVDPFPYLQSWQSGGIESGADGVGWYQASTARLDRRTANGSPLPSLTFGVAGAPDVLPIAGDWDGDGRDSVGRLPAVRCDIPRARRRGPRSGPGGVRHSGP